MRRRLCLLLSIFLSAAVLAGSAPASTAKSDSAPIELGAVNIISGDRTAGMLVSVPTEAFIPEEPFSNPNVSYEGDGRVVGFVLVADAERLSKAYQLISTRWDFCGKPGCSGGWKTSLTYGFNWQGHHGYRIPPGDYRLYLIADEAPARVILRLDGLTGVASLSPTAPTANRLAVPEEMTSSPGSNLSVGRARPMIMPTTGLMIDGDSNEYGPGGGAQGSCFWRPDEPEGPEREVAGPHCITFAERGGAGASFSTLGGGFRSWGAGNVGPGDWRSSYWSTYASPWANPQFLTLWLAYERPER